jgi:cob(I)alamin adenosyltransferase
LKKFNDIKILRYSRDFGFFFTANEQVKQEMIRENNANLDEAISIANQGLCDLLVLDEVCAAYNNNALDKKNADEFILNKPQGLELVLTGRNAPKHFIEAADYVTEFVNHKHPYENGIAARIGIEY